MLFVITAFDTPDGTGKRQELYPAHKDYLTSATADGSLSIVMAGPLVRDDGATPCGSLFIVDAPSRAIVEAFHAADPFKLRSTGFGQIAASSHLSSAEGKDHVETLFVASIWN
jgi:uncharacterized protein YciI